MNNSATGSYGLGPPDWPFSEATALTQAQRCTKLPRRVVGADGGLALRNVCSPMQTGVGSGCRCTSQLRNDFTGKGNESWGLRPRHSERWPNNAVFSTNNEELNHRRGPSDFRLLSIWFPLKKHFCCSVKFDDSEGCLQGPVPRVSRPLSFYFHVSTSCSFSHL